MTYNDLGRTVKSTDSAGRITYTVYLDGQRTVGDATILNEVRTYSVWDGDSAMLPTSISREVVYDLGGGETAHYSESISMTATPAVDENDRPTGEEAISGIVSLSRSFYNSAGQATESRSYSNLDGVSYTLSPNLGSAGTNYLTSTTTFDPRGRRAVSQNAAGTIVHTFFDALSRVTMTWKGTDDVPTTDYNGDSTIDLRDFRWYVAANGTAPANTNMVKFTSSVYDTDDNVILSIQYPGGSAENRVSQQFYDFRGRMVAGKSGVLLDAQNQPDPENEADDVQRMISYQEYNNLGEMLVSEQYDGDGVEIVDADADGTPDRPDEELLRAKSISAYDKLGREYRRTVFAVNPISGVIGAGTLTMDTFHDDRSLVIKTIAPDGAETLFSHDRLGRMIERTDADPDGTGPLTSPVSTFEYDSADNLANSTDPLGRMISYEYDLAGRQTETTLPDPDGAGPLEAPVLTTTYNPAGNVASQTDALGDTTSYTYDLLGRGLTVTQPDPDGTGPLTSPVSSVVYDSGGRMSESIDPLGNTTTYEYDLQGNVIATTMPDPDGSGPLTSPVTHATYNQLGNVLTQTDALGGVTEYEYDLLGRMATITQPDPDGAGGLPSPTAEYAYTVLGQTAVLTDVLGRTVSFVYL